MVIYDIVNIIDPLFTHFGLVSCLCLNQWPLAFLMTPSDWTMSCHVLIMDDGRGWKHHRGTHKFLTPLLSPRWVNTSSSCWRQTRTPPSRTPALLGLGWIPPDLGAFNLGLIAPVTALTLGYRSAWSLGTALSHLGSASLVAQGLYSDIGLQNVGTNGLSFVLGRLSYRTSIYTCRYT